MRGKESGGYLQLPLFPPSRETKVPELKRCKGCGRFVIETVLDEKGLCHICRGEPLGRK